MTTRIGARQNEPVNDAGDRFRGPLARVGRFTDAYERGPVPGSMSMVERLPAWLKSAKNRGAVLRGIRRLRSSQPAT